MGLRRCWLAVGLLLASGGVWAYPWSRVLQPGMSGADVVELQIRIGGWINECPAQTFLAWDGQFGPATAQTLRRFQNGYKIPVTGVADAATQTLLNSLEKADGSTLHFNFSEFYSHDGQQFSDGNVPAAEVQENIRRLMYKLEALRHKMGDHPVTIVSGFRSIDHNDAVDGAGNSMHLYGVASDILVSTHTLQEIYDVAQTCGFSGIEHYDQGIGQQHMDSRKQYPQYGSDFWWWEKGTEPLNGCLEDPPTMSGVAGVLRAAAGLLDATAWKTWDTAPNPSTDPRGFGNGHIGIEDAVRALRRADGLEPFWP